MKSLDERGSILGLLLCQPSFRYSLTVANNTIEQCSLPCQGNGFVPTFFTIQIRNYLRLWTGAWAVACFVCTLFTILTFLIDLHRFEFPERAILYLALCHLFVSVIYMIGLTVEDNLSCSAVSATKSSLVTQVRRLGMATHPFIVILKNNYFFKNCISAWSFRNSYSFFRALTTLLVRQWR